VADEELFCRHTYLATLAKLMVWKRFSDKNGSLTDTVIISILEGRFFRDIGIENFLEEDFFSWLARNGAKEVAIKITTLLKSLLNNYWLKDISEDVLKSLYQELVDPQTSHDLGEFYTPDWLDDRMVKKLIAQNPEGSFIDPSGGSGTFLYLVIREKRKRLGNSPKTLKHICNSVVGIDIHPLAVIIAKTNYLLALGDLLTKRNGKINLPVYLANSIRLPERDVETTFWRKTPSYKIDIEKKVIHLPGKLIGEDIGRYDSGIESARDFARDNAGKSVTEAQFQSFLSAQYLNLSKDPDIVKALFYVAEILKEFIEAKRDTIQAFVLKNTYKPIFLKDKFDFVIGNPHWLAFRYAEPEYQRFLKNKITEYYHLLSGRGHLITHMELGTLFFLATAELYLKEGGIIAFVLPRNIFSADQHDGLRQGVLVR
jgi:hypothetical protein